MRTSETFSRVSSIGAETRKDVQLVERDRYLGELRPAALDDAGLDLAVLGSTLRNRILLGLAALAGIGDRAEEHGILPAEKL